MKDKMKELKWEIGSVTRHLIKKREESLWGEWMFQCGLYSNLVLKIKNWFSFRFDEFYSDSAFLNRSKKKKRLFLSDLNINIYLKSKS